MRQPSDDLAAEQPQDDQPDRYDEDRPRLPPRLDQIALPVAPRQPLRMDRERHPADVDRDIQPLDRRRQPAPLEAGVQRAAQERRGQRHIDGFRPKRIVEPRAREQPEQRDRGVRTQIEQRIERARRMRQSRQRADHGAQRQRQPEPTRQRRRRPRKHHRRQQQQPGGTATKQQVELRDHRRHGVLLGIARENHDAFGLSSMAAPHGRFANLSRPVGSAVHRRLGPLVARRHRRAPIFLLRWLSRIAG